MVTDDDASLYLLLQMTHSMSHNALELRPQTLLHSLTHHTEQTADTTHDTDVMSIVQTHTQHPLYVCTPHSAS